MRVLFTFCVSSLVHGVVIARDCPGNQGRYSAALCTLLLGTYVALECKCKLEACTPVQSASSARLWCAPQCTVHAFGVHLIPSAPQCTPSACTQVHSARLRRAPHFQCTPVHAFGVHSISSALQCTPSACTPVHSAGLRPCTTPAL